MIIYSGTKNRSIAAQNQFSYSFDGLMSNSTGISNIGFSGDSGNINLFKFSSGKIYDIENRHVWSYNPNQSINISGNIGTGHTNYYVNNNLVCLFTKKPNAFYKYFYINTDKTTVDFNLKINGNTGSLYSFVFPFTNYVGDQITGYLVNQNPNLNFSFEIFSGESFAQQYYTLTTVPTGFVSGSKSGQLILTYTSTGIDPNIFSSGNDSITGIQGYFIFNSNFGNFPYSFAIPVLPKPLYYADLIQIFTGVSGTSPFIYYDYSYNFQTKSSGDQNVFISLNNFTGHSGNLYNSGFAATGIISGSGSKFIEGFDYITGLSSGRIISLQRDFSGQFLTGNFITNKSILQVATGKIDYYYNILIYGGSGLARAPKGLTITGSGYALLTPSNVFIFGSRNVTGKGTGILTGYWSDIIQTGSGEGIVSNFEYFTGRNSELYENFFWDGIPYFGYDYLNTGVYKIYGITGITGYLIESFDSGIKNIQEYIYTNQRTGILLKSLVNLNSDDINVISGTTFGSNNLTDIPYVFGKTDGPEWVTDINIRTGYVGFSFTNFSPRDSGIVSHYELQFDKNFTNYKYIPTRLTLQGSNNNIAWNDLDDKQNLNLYNSSSNIFRVQNPGLYNSIRLIISGNELAHVNKEFLEDPFTYQNGLSIKKLYLYQNSGLITGNFDNLIKNPTDSRFISHLNTGEEIYISTGLKPFLWFTGSQNLRNDWSTITTSLDSSVQIAGGNNTYLYISINSGNTWVTGVGKKNWTSSSSSFDGKFLSCTASNDRIYISHDSGKNWSGYANYLDWSAIDISYDGRHQIAFVKNGTIPAYISRNTGVTWSGLSGANFNEPISSIQWKDVALSKTGSYALACGNNKVFRSINSGFNWVDLYDVSADIQVAANWSTAAMSADGKIQTIATDDINGILYRSINFGQNWTNHSTGQWAKVRMSYDGRIQAGGLIDNQLRVSYSTGRVWSGYNVSKNWKGISVSSGGDNIFAAASNSYDRIFDSDGAENNWYAFNKNFSTVSLTGTGINKYYNNIFLGYESYEPLQGNTITGFYISFENGYTPKQLTLEVSNSGNNYIQVYRKNTGINLIETGSISGFTISTNTGYKFYRFSFNENLPLEQIGINDTLNGLTCYSGWNINTGIATGQWFACDMSANGRVQAVVQDLSSGSLSRFTGEMLFSYNYGNTWNTTYITGTAASRVTLSDIAVSKQDGRYVLACRGGNNEYPLLFSTNSGTGFNWLGTGSGAYWKSAAMSYDGSIMIAVGNYYSVRLLSAMRSINTGLTWVRVPPANLGGNINLNKVVASYDGSIIAATSDPGSIYISTNTGVNWTPRLTDTPRAWKNIAMSANGSHITAVSDFDFVWVSNDTGNNWRPYFDDLTNFYHNGRWRGVCMSSGGEYQTIVGESISSTNIAPPYISNDTGNSWNLVSNFNDLNYFEDAACSSDGKYQIFVGTKTSTTLKDKIYSNCIYGSGEIFNFQEVRIKDANLYTAKNNNYFNTYINAITGSGNLNFRIFGSATGIISGITGSGYQNAVFYQTGLLTGLVSHDSTDGIFTWNNITISGTGLSNRVFLENPTGYKQSTGIVNFKTGLLEPYDILNISNYDFYYVTGQPTNLYEFNSLNYLINVLNSGATGAFLDNPFFDYPLYNQIGITGYKIPSQDTLILFSYLRSGEDGNQIRLYRDTSNLDAVSIPHRYLRSGQTFRAPVDNGKWSGLFRTFFSSVQKENTGVYIKFFEPETIANGSLTGVIFENNFDKNWKIFVTPISEGGIFNTGLTTGLIYNPVTKLFSGNFIVKSGLTYLGYSGLQINLNKRSFDHINNTGNLARYVISGNRFSFTGLIKG